jgi:hypothetical protein
VEIDQLEQLEDLDKTKDILEKAIARSTYLSQDTTNQRPLQIRWNLANLIDLATIKVACPNGYADFVRAFILVAKVAVDIY